MIIVTKKYFTMNFATTKERILQYIEYKGLTVSKFLKETGIKRGFLDSDKLKSAVSDNFIAIIIAVYNDLNVEWLITGNGDMIRQNNSQNKNEQLIKHDLINEQPSKYNSSIDIINDYNIHLKKEVEELKKDKQMLIDDKLLIVDILKSKLFNS